MTGPDEVPVKGGVLHQGTSTLNDAENFRKYILPFFFSAHPSENPLLPSTKWTFYASGLPYAFRSDLAR